jgi:hypothetical protein
MFAAQNPPGGYQVGHSTCPIQKEIYITQPEGYVNQPHLPEESQGQKQAHYEALIRSSFKPIKVDMHLPQEALSSLSMFTTASSWGTRSYPMEAALLAKFKMDLGKAKSICIWDTKSELCPCEELEWWLGGLFSLLWFYRSLPSSLTVLVPLAISQHAVTSSPSGERNTGSQKRKPWPTPPPAAQPHFANHGLFSKHVACTSDVYKVLQEGSLCLMGHSLPLPIPSLATSVYS